MKAYSRVFSNLFEDRVIEGTGVSGKAPRDFVCMFQSS